LVLKIIPAHFLCNRRHLYSPEAFEEMPSKRGQ